MSRPLTPLQRQRRAKFAALVKSTPPKTGSHFCTPFSHDPYGINTETRLDKDKTQVLKRAAI